MTNLPSKVKLIHTGWKESVSIPCRRIQTGFSASTLINPHFVPLIACFSLLSCWKMDLCPGLKPFGASNRFTFTVLYLAPSMFPSAWKIFHFSANKKHPHRIMLLPPCFMMITRLCVLLDIYRILCFLFLFISLLVGKTI